MYPTLSAALATVRRIAKQHNCRIAIELCGASDAIDVYAARADVNAPNGQRIIAEAFSYDGGPTLDEAVEAVARQLEAL